MRHADGDRDGSHDFDFYTGRWRVRNERLVERLKGGTEREVFEACSDARMLPGGLGNTDVLTTDHWPGFVGMTVRLYDPRTATWRLYWTSNRLGMFAPPVVGAFADGIGRFEGRDEEDGRLIIVRFAPGPRSARPTLAGSRNFSADEGLTWEKNWIMVSTREDG